MTYDEALHVLDLTHWERHFYYGHGKWAHDLYDATNNIWVRNSAWRETKESSEAALIAWVEDGCPTILSAREDAQKYKIGDPVIIGEIHDVR